MPVQVVHPATRIAHPPQTGLPQADSPFARQPAIDVPSSYGSVREIGDRMSGASLRQRLRLRQEGSKDDGMESRKRARIVTQDATSAVACGCRAATASEASWGVCAASAQSMIARRRNGVGRSE